MIADSKLGTVEEFIFEYGEYLIGQDSQCDIRLVDRAASRKHARLFFDASGLRVEDLGSANGTFLGGQRIESPHELGAGTLRIGRCKVIVVIDDQAHSDRAESARLRVAVLHPGLASHDSCSFKDTREVTGDGTPIDRSGDAEERRADSAQITYRIPSMTEEASVKAAIDADSHPKLALSVGAEIEFFTARSTKRLLRLKSISGQGGVYFFRDQQSSGTSLCLTAERLSQHLEERSARVMGCSVA